MTFRADGPFAGSAPAVHARLRRTARAGYGGVIWTGEQAIVSHSPELFFALRDGRVMARPMKGTAARLADPAADAAAARELAEAPKQIGRAACRERVGKYVSISVVAGSLTKKKQ